jgi:hypothetical protein
VAGIDRLRQVLVEARPPRTFYILWLCVPTDGDQPDAAIGRQANAPRNFVPIENGQSDIDECDVRSCACGNMQRRLPITRFCNSYPSISSCKRSISRTSRLSSTMSTRVARRENHGGRWIRAVTGSGSRGSRIVKVAP